MTALLLAENHRHLSRKMKITGANYLAELFCTLTKALRHRTKDEIYTGARWREPGLWLLLGDLLQHPAITVAIKARLYPKRPDTLLNFILAQRHFRCET
jgi:hypothetical protein